MQNILFMFLISQPIEIRIHCVETKYSINIKSLDKQSSPVRKKAQPGNITQEYRKECCGSMQEIYQIRYPKRFKQDWDINYTAVLIHIFSRKLRHLNLLL